MIARLERIRRLEEVGFRTWPAFERSRYDGWELRVSAGVSRRANSVNPVRRSSLPLATKIDHCERWFTERRQPPVFRLTELADPELPQALEARNYMSESPTSVMVSDLASAMAPSPGRSKSTDVHIEPAITEGWFDAFCAWNGRDPSQGATLRRLLESIPGTCAYASTSVDGATAAVGLGVVAEGWVGIYNMNTAPEFRRRGLGSLILGSLLAFGREWDASTAFLQVLHTNGAARRLYVAAGFRNFYDYWYLGRAQAP